MFVAGESLSSLTFANEVAWGVLVPRATSRCFRIPRRIFLVSLATVSGLGTLSFEEISDLRVLVSRVGEMHAGNLALSEKIRDWIS